MRWVPSLGAHGVLVAAMVALCAPPTFAQERTLVRQLDDVLAATADTPAGQGLLPLAIAEAWGGGGGRPRGG